MMQTSPRNILVVTGTRADYGHLYWLMRELQCDAGVRLLVAVTGAHLCKQWGDSEQVILNDGFDIDARIEMQLAGDSGVAVNKSLALGIIGFADAYQQLNPDIVVLLGDRYEELAAAQACLFLRIPVAHIHGGETSEGAVDESIRHAVTKLSHLHFVAAEPYKERVLQLGENPSMVFNFGAPGLDHLTRTEFLSAHELCQKIGLSFLDKPFFIVTYHPATLGFCEPALAIDQLLRALEVYPQSVVVFTGVNTDMGNSDVTTRIKDFTRRFQHRVRFFDSLGQTAYLSALKYADAVIGNSSSGLIEAPALGVPTVNIGDRQKGRLKAVSVIDCAENAEDISRAIDLALSETFIKRLPERGSLYGAGNASFRIAQTLKSVNLENVLQKHFFSYPASLSPPLTL